MRPHPTLVGRERELASLQRVLETSGPRIVFVDGLAGIGKSALLDAFSFMCEASGTETWRVDCAGIDPTESGFQSALERAGWEPGRAGVA
jgi:hypothetical protein